MKLLLLILFLFFHYCFGVIYKLNYTEYSRMPPLFYMDDYDSCVTTPGGLYCSVQAELFSNTPSELLTMIQEYSLHTTTHFNHSRLAYGLCVTTTCKNYYNETLDRRDVLEACLNQSIWEKYQLNVKVSDKYYCNTPQMYEDIDALDVFVAVLVIAILVMNTVGSLYDFYFSTDDENDRQYLLYFSIRRNWRKLAALSSTCSDPRLRRLQAFNGIKAISMMLVIFSHAMLPSLSYMDNPYYLENYMYSNLGMHIFMNSTILIRFYVIVSAFLLTYNLQLYAEKHELSWTLLPKNIMHRLIRLSPVYFLVLVWDMTWERFLGSGPAWYRGPILEMEDCRQNWWKHFLYVNNYFDGSNCNIPSWYLAADMQLHCLALVVLLYCRSTSSKKVVVSLLIFIGTIAPAMHVYFQDLYPLPLTTPNAAQYIFVNDDTFDYVYKRGHDHIANCAFGIALGYIVYYNQQNNFDATKYKKYRFLIWLLPPLGMLAIMSAYCFYLDQPKIFVGFRLLYSLFIFPMFSFFLCVLFWAFIMKIEDLYRCVLEWRGWAAPARVCYCAFVSHVTIIRIVCGARTTLAHTDLLHITRLALYVLILSLIVAVPLFIMVESPFAQLLRMRPTTKSSLNKNRENGVEVTNENGVELSSGSSLNNKNNAFTVRL